MIWVPQVISAALHFADFERSSFSTMRAGSDCRNREPKRLFCTVQYVFGGQKRPVEAALVGLYTTDKRGGTALRGLQNTLSRFSARLHVSFFQYGKCCPRKTNELIVLRYAQPTEVLENTPSLCLEMKSGLAELFIEARRIAT